jgi:hypothetical protein
LNLPSIVFAPQSRVSKLSEAPPNQEGNVWRGVFTKLEYLILNLSPWTVTERASLRGMMWRPCRAYSGQDAWALAWCPARPRRRHDIMAPRSGFPPRPSLQSKTLRHLRQRAGLTQGQLAEPLGVTCHAIQALAPCARDGTLSSPKRSAAPSAICARPRALLAAKSGGKHGSI